MGVKKNALAGSQSPNSDPCEGTISVDHHRQKVERLSRAKAHSEVTLDYLISIAQNPKLNHNNASKKEAKRVVKNMMDCGDYLRFHHYFSVDEYRLVQASFCGQNRVCQLCATRHGSKAIQAYLPKYQMLRTLYPHLQAYMVTFTVKDGPNLGERMEHLRQSFRRGMERRRDFVKKGRGSSIFTRIEGAVGAYEVTIGKNSGEWHPHIHMVILAESMPIMRGPGGAWRCPGLEEEWEVITGDSKVVDVRPFDESQTPEKSFCEVFKYALKFSAMEPEDVWTAYKTLRGMRLRFSYGLFRGVEIPEELTDEPLEGLPYVDILYSYLTDVGYTVLNVNHVAVPSVSHFPGGSNAGSVHQVG